MSVKKLILLKLLTNSNQDGAVALAIFNRKCDGPFLVEKVVNYACFGG